MRLVLYGLVFFGRKMHPAKKHEIALKGIKARTMPDQAPARNAVLTPFS